MSTPSKTPPAPVEMKQGTEQRRTALFLIGTRPELIKMAPVVWSLPANLRGVVCFTGQHESLVDDLAPRLQVRPDHRLRVMRPGQPLSTLTARLLEEIGDLIGRVAPDVVVGQGDTATVLAGSLAAFFHRVPFAHVEAGLRSQDLSAPFPEEANRRLAAVTTSIHFAPTARAVAHLRAEGIPMERIRLVGNPVVDAVRATARTVTSTSASSRPTILLTTHRRENFGAPLGRILEAVRRLSRTRPDVEIVWPVHPNPMVREASASLRDLDNVKLDVAWYNLNNLELEIWEYLSHPVTGPITPRPVDALGYNMIVLDVSSAELAAAKLVEAGGVLVAKAAPMDGGRMAFGRDPDGNLLGLFEVSEESPYSAVKLGMLASG